MSHQGCCNIVFDKEGLYYISGWSIYIDIVTLDSCRFTTLRSLPCLPVRLCGDLYLQGTDEYISAVLFDPKEGISYR